MSAWLHNAMYDGVTPEQFVRSDLAFVFLPDSAVECERVMKAHEYSSRH